MPSEVRYIWYVEGRFVERPWVGVSGRMDLGGGAGGGFVGLRIFVLVIVGLHIGVTGLVGREVHS